MHTRQANFLFIFLPALLIFGGLSACSSPIKTMPPTQIPAPTVLATSPTPAATAINTAAASTERPSSAVCHETKGTLEIATLDSPPLPQYHIYLPPCYHQNTRQRYPVLYLIHGQGFTDDQWVRLGVPQIANRLIAAGQMPPYIIVMPFNATSWREPDHDFFDRSLIDILIPHVDNHYSSMPTRDYRAIGGLSRGGGWAIELGLQHWQLFGKIGGHSTSVFHRNTRRTIQNWISQIPPTDLPAIYLDIGEQDQMLKTASFFKGILDELDIPHQWRVSPGSHDEAYWSAHVEEYLLWYAQGWDIR